MKKVLSVLLIVSIFSLASYIEHNYTRKDCEVTAVTASGVLIKDKCGFIWYYDEPTDLKVGDKVDLKMHDNCSNSNIDDDEIKKVVRAE